jgi:hypothetical protein
MKHINLFLFFKRWSILLLSLCPIVVNSATYYAPSNQLRGGEIQSFTEHTYGKVEIRMYSQKVTGTTSTFFWWKDGGQDCGNQWNEIDIELIPDKNQYQSNPIWQRSDADCETKTWEDLHGDEGIFGRWVVYTVEWAPNYIAWYHDGQLDRWIGENDTRDAVNYIDHAMKYCFNLWSQGSGNPAWLGDLDFDVLQNHPVYQFVDYFKFYDWNGGGFNSTPSETIDFNNVDDIYNNFNVSNWEFGQSLGYLSWSQDAVGIVNLSEGNGALWLGLFYSGQERPPLGSEIPSSSDPLTLPDEAITVEAESALNYNGLDVAGEQIGYITDGAWASYAPVTIGTAGQYQVSYEVAGDSNAGSIQLEQSGGATVYGSVTVPVTGGWTNWTTVSHIVTLPQGENSFGLYFATGGFNLNNFTITPLDTTPVASNTIEIQAETTSVYANLTVGGDSLGYIADGAWARYGVVNIPTAGDYVITYQVASANGGGMVQFEQAGGGTVYGAVNVLNTGAWTNWTPVSHTVTLPAGNLDLALAFPAGGFNLDSFTISPAQ